MQDETSTDGPISLIERLKNEEINSETLTGNPKSRSVYDFLYHDARRVASFLAQFVEHGAPGLIKTSSGVDDAHGDKKSGSGGVGVPGFVQGQAMIERSTATSIKDSTEKSFDPFWSNAVNFLDYIDSEDLLQRNVSEARLGQIVMVSGPLIVIDPSMLKDFYKENSFKQQMRSGVISPSKGGAKEQNIQFDILVNMLSKMPHTIQAHFLPEEYSAWASLNAESLVSASSDIMLKNGAAVPGIWNMVGIMDGFPDYRIHPDENGMVPNYDQFIQDRMTAPVVKVMAAFAPVIRQAIGRPNDYYALTPLVIFREIGSKDTST